MRTKIKDRQFDSRVKIIRNCLLTFADICADITLECAHLKSSSRRQIMRRNLTELAGNPDLISGIYNYCDRWCERCPFTSRCLVYATEKEDEDESPESRDITNEAFWQKLGSIFQEAREMIASWAEEAGVDLTEIDLEREAQREKRHTDAARHRLALAGKEKASAVTEWFTELSQRITSSDVRPDEADLELS